MSSRASLWFGLLLALGCGGSSPDRVTAVCDRVADATCAKFVECHAEFGGMVVTATLCQQLRSGLVGACIADDKSSIATATDADVDACVQGLAAQACSTICNQVPMDPPACHPLSPTPNTDTVTCQAP